MSLSLCRAILALFSLGIATLAFVVTGSFVVGVVTYIVVLVLNLLMFEYLQGTFSKIRN